MFRPIREASPLDPARSAAVIIAIWIVGSLACRVVGVWGGVGGAAIIAGSLTWIFHRKALGPLLCFEARHFRAGVTAGMVMTLSTYLLYPVLCGIFPGLSDATRGLYTLFNQGWTPLRLVLLPLVILGEELVWRGLVLTVLERRWGRTAAVLLGSVIYATAHLPAATPLLALVALGCGIYWSVLRAASCSLVPALIAHLLWDAAVMVLFPLTQ